MFSTIVNFIKDIGWELIFQLLILSGVILFFGSIYFL